MLSQTELKERVSAIRSRGITPAEVAEENRILRIRLNERLEVSLNRLRELNPRWSQDERHCNDAMNEAKLALLREIERVQNDIKFSQRPAEDYHEELLAFVGRIVDEFKTSIDKSEKSKNLSERKYYSDQLDAVRKATSLLTNELSKLAELWDTDKKSCAEQRQSAREAEVLNLVRGQEDERNAMADAERGRRHNEVAREIEAHQDELKAAGVSTEQNSPARRYSY